MEGRPSPAAGGGSAGDGEGAGDGFAGGQNRVAGRVGVLTADADLGARLEDDVPVDGGVGLIEALLIVDDRAGGVGGVLVETGEGVAGAFVVGTELVDGAGA